MSALSVEWLADTLLWTAALIALVLVLRRPVARHFGPHMAYALWTLPLLRLLLPPIELPAWLAPATPEPASQVAASQPAIDQFSIILEPTTVALAQPAAAQSPWPVLEIVLCVWLVGACSFLFLRFRGYFDMRRKLLVEAREVGRAGNIRLIETPETSAPLAFGVLDKVVALPEGFMALSDRETRDMAVEHELSHHRGNDLLINILVQPLFALHWFNPLSRLGWLALRRDQEAACDARVLARKEPEERAIYANVIASFAAGPNVALAAPMACPVLGDKSIIHRLRSLQMSDISSRRRMAGRGLLVAAALAIPTTASITYAEEIAAIVPSAPPAPAAPLAPTAPAAPAAPSAPLAPDAPIPPMPLGLQASGEVDVEADVETKVEKSVEKKVFVIRSDDDEKGDTKKNKMVVREIHAHQNGKMLSEEEIEEIMVEVREGLAEADIAVKEAKTIGLKLEREYADGQHTTVEMSCEGDGMTSEKISDDGKKTVLICQSKIMAHALTGLKEAREQIAKSEEFPENLREQVLEEIDRQIKDWDKRDS